MQVRANGDVSCGARSITILLPLYRTFQRAIAARLLPATLARLAGDLGADRLLATPTRGEPVGSRS